MTPERLPQTYDVKQKTLPSHKVLRIIKAKAKNARMCSESLIAIELKGLAAPGEALRIHVFRIFQPREKQQKHKVLGL